uniref:Cell division protein n=1 Tax=Bracteacoccus aerius TaxID=50041 RepID=A0A140HAS9_9CHLO|nr:cell division protein [Bracteacoccus aerius]AMO01278.1 cell division protein [Bracteacoccus aerius]
METCQLKVNKFDKKRHFLQISLLKFLYWRDTTLNSSVTEKQVRLNAMCDRETTVEQELLLVRNFLQFFNKNKFFFNKLSTDTFFEKNNQKKISTLSSISSFFPQKHLFMYYWVLPFVGFVSLTYLNRENPFKFYPSLELWPYLTKSAIMEKNWSYAQKNANMTPNAVPFSTDSKREVCSLSWETLEYLNYKKLIYDQSKKFMAEIHTNEDNLCFIVKPNWIEHQKNQYSLTFKDKNLEDNFSRILSLEKKEIENLWKCYFHETQDFIYSQLREKSNPEKFPDIPNLSSKTDIEGSRGFKWYFGQTKKNQQKKSKSKILDDILVKNLWNRSSIYWYWYQINPNKIEHSVIPGNFFSSDTLKKNNIIKSVNFANFSRQTQSGTTQQNFHNSFESRWLDLDEFPKKMFPVTISSDIFHLRKHKTYNNYVKPSLDRQDKKQTNEWMHHEKDLTLSLFSILKTEPVQSYQKSSLLLDNFIKKLQLERNFLVPQNLFKHREIVKQKSDFVSLFKNKSNNMYALKYTRQNFLPTRFNSDSFDAPISSTLFNQPVPVLIKNRNERVTFFSDTMRKYSKTKLNTSVKKQVSKNLQKIFLIKYLNSKTKNLQHNVSFDNIHASSLWPLAFGGPQEKLPLVRVRPLVDRSLQFVGFFESNQGQPKGKTENFKQFNDESENSTVAKTWLNPTNKSGVNIRKADRSHKRNLLNQFDSLNSYRKFFNELIDSKDLAKNKIALYSEKFKNLTPQVQHTKQAQLKPFWKKQHAYLSRFLSILRKIKITREGEFFDQLGHLDTKNSPYRVKHRDSESRIRTDFNNTNLKDKRINISKISKQLNGLNAAGYSENISSENIRDMICELCVLCEFNQHLKKIFHSPSIVDGSQRKLEFSRWPLVDRRENLTRSQSENLTAGKTSNNPKTKSKNRALSKIPKLSYNRQNFHLNEILNNTKNIELKKQNQKSINIFRLQNPMIMSGYEFPEFCIRDFKKYTDKISKKLETRDDANRILSVSLPPNFSRAIYNTLKFAAPLSLSSSHNTKNDTIKSFMAISYLQNVKNQYNDIFVKKQNSFLFETHDDFFTSLKQNNQLNLNSYWSSNDQKNAIPSELPKTTSLLKMQNNVMNQTTQNEFFNNQKRWILKLKSFYEHFQKIVRSLLIKLNTLLKLICRRLQLKLLDQHNFESYSAVDLSNDFSEQSQKIILSNDSQKIRDLPSQKHDTKQMLSTVSNLWLTKGKTQKLCEKNSKTDEKAASSILYFKTFKNFEKQSKNIPLAFDLAKEKLDSSRGPLVDRSLWFEPTGKTKNSTNGQRGDNKHSQIDQHQIKLSFPKMAHAFSVRTFKLDKTKKCLKHSALFKNVEKRKIEKIFRTYLSCKSSEAASAHEGPTMYQKKQKVRIKMNGYYITNALKRLQIRVKHNLLISKKNNLKNVFVFKSINEKQESKSAHISNVSSALKSDSLLSNKNKSHNKHISLKLYRISPNSLLKRLGFIFLNRNDKCLITDKSKTRSTSINHLTPIFPAVNQRQTLAKIMNEHLSPVLIGEKSHIHEYKHRGQHDEMQNKRLEKQKRIQKKRRRKKQKLENRRRKKRKRFYPRPKWLRYELYKNFMKKRHFKHNLSCRFGDIKNLNRFPNYHLVKTAQTKDANLSKVSSNQSASSIHFVDNFVFQNKIRDRLLKTKIYRQNKQQWGVTENPNFEKLCVKKMPLGWSLPIFANHDFYRISNGVMSDFQRLCWKSYWLRSNLTPYIRRIQSSMQKIHQSQIHEQSSKTLTTFVSHLLGFNLPQISPHLFNDQTTHPFIRVNQFISNKTLNATSFVFARNDWTGIQSNGDFSNYSNKPSIFLTSKKSPQLLWYLNVKPSFQNRNTVSNFSLFENTQNVAEYNRILYERILDIIKNVKFNLNVNGQSHAKSFKRGRRKTARATAKTLGFWTQLACDIDPDIRAFSPFASMIDASIKPYGDLPTLRTLWALNKTNAFSFKPKNAVRNLWANERMRQQKKSNKTKKFLSDSRKKIFPESFDEYCFRKALFVEDKIRYTGFIKKDYQNYLIRLKMQFKSIDFSINSLNNSTIFKKQDLSKVSLQSVASYRNSSQPQKHTKRSMFFWWSDFPHIQRMNFSSMFMQQNCMLPNFSKVESSFLNFAAFSSLWACTVLFHVCSLFFVLNIPEIRSLMKFNLLIVYKISNSYLFLIYSIYDLLQKYKNRVIRSFEFVYSRLINKTTRVSSFNNTAISKNNFESEAYTDVSILSSLAHFRGNQLPHKGTFLEVTFRVIPPDGTLTSALGGNLQQIFTNYTNIKILCNVERSSTIFSDRDKFDADESEDKTINEPLVVGLFEAFPTVESSLWSTKDQTENTNTYFISRDVFDLNEFEPQSSDENESSGETSEQQISSEIADNRIRKLFTIIYNKLPGRFKHRILLVFLFIAKFSIALIHSCVQLWYTLLFKIIDIVESVMLVIYKFLEKPAELLIEWIAQIFLVEWSSDIMTYLPEALDSSIWNSYVKLSRSSKITGPVGFLLQRRLWCFMELFIDFVSKPDADLVMRQKKGTIFWNIWAEILIQAAERYNINVQSLTTSKEEQELLIERLLDDETWDWYKTSMGKAHNQMIPLIEFIGSVENHEQTQNGWSSDVENKNVVSSISLSTQKIQKARKSSHAKREIQRIIRSCNKGLLKDRKLAPKIDGNVDDIWRRWAANQYFTYQGRDTDLFIDIHPPKCFRHMSAIQYYQPAQQTLGNLVCQIYSGRFSKQVSKNILVIGAPGSGKSLLVQALAGETELKIITDNAHRYALVESGVAVGIKLLRDVFDAIALHTPCLFLMEDIHAIGERRPLLISDDENVQATESFFASESEEVHEKEQSIYQLTKHAISHYKKPYKGDFSLLIPTNYFCFELFLGVSPPRTRRSGLTPKSPLDIKSIEKELNQSRDEAVLEQSFTNMSVSRNKRFPFDTLVSHLQLPSRKYFAPPPTSPFTILMMKEQKKLVPKKLIKQIPWNGLSWEQMMLLSKVNYSIRVKVALLADIAIRNISVKLDMITDLLVIMDSVRSNRGFVVFATTHVPFVLDPALRRPGRLDETISLPSLPDLLTRWEIFKTNLSNFTSTLDFMDYSLLSSNLTDTQISNFISKTKLLLFNTAVDITHKTHNVYFDRKITVKNHSHMLDIFAPYETNRQVFSSLDTRQTLGSRKAIVPAMFSNKANNFIHNEKQIDLKRNKFPIYSLNEAIKITMNADMIEPSQITDRIQRALKKVHHATKSKHSFVNQSQLKSKNPNKKITRQLSPTKSTMRNQASCLVRLLTGFDVYPSIGAGSSNLISLTYFQMGKFLINSQLLFDQTSYGKITWSKFLVSHNMEEQSFRDLYSPRYDLKNRLMHLFSGKVGEFFIFNNSSLCRYFSSQPKNLQKSVNSVVHYGFQHSGFWNLVGIHPFWNSANSFVCSLMQKRYLYNKNLLISRMLYFEDISAMSEAPSPPESSILMPTKKYENLKRTENDFQQKATMSIHQKIQLHQQQRLMRKLYDQPVHDCFRSEMIENHFTRFNSSVKELGHIHSFIRRPSSVNCYYRNRILIRHQFSLLNQWWNGQLAEHSAETTFLSDVDWRSIFNKSLGDLLIDFPDADQHYNPRQRRWFLQSSYWSYWNSFDQTMTQEISYHFMVQCFNKAYNFLNNEREILDYFAHSFLQKGILNEIDLVTVLSRFHHNPRQIPTTVLK